MFHVKHFAVAWAAPVAWVVLVVRALGSMLVVLVMLVVRVVGALRALRVVLVAWFMRAALVVRFVRAVLVVRGAGALLADVGHALGEHGVDVVVGEGVDDVLAVAGGFHKARLLQRAQLVAHGALGAADDGGDVADG